MTQPERAEDQSWLSWQLYRHRRDLVPIWAWLSLLLLAMILHVQPMTWLLVLLGTAFGVFLVLERGPRVRVHTPPEQRYALAILIGVGLWLTAAVWSGPFTPLLLVLYVGLLALAVPYWRSQDRQYVAALDKVQEIWPEVATAARISGVELRKAVMRRPGVWTGVLVLPKGQVLGDVIPNRPRIESALGLRPRSIELREDISMARQVVMEVVEHDLHAKAVPWTMPTPGGSILKPVVLGQYQNGESVLVKLAYQHVGIAGATGSGKSGFLNCLIGNLAACVDVVMWGCDLKHGLELRPWGPVLAWTVKTVPEAKDMFRAVLRIMKSRGQWLEQQGLRLWPISPERPVLVVIIDEQAELAIDPECVRMVEHISSQGRALGVQLVTATQHPTVDDLGTSIIPQQLSAKVSLRVLDANATGVALGKGKVAEGFEPHKLPKNRPGMFYITAPDAEEPRPARAPLVSDHLVQQTVRQFKGMRPTLDQSSDQVAKDVKAEPEVPQTRTKTPEDTVLEALEAAGEAGLAAKAVKSLLLDVHGVSKTDAYGKVLGPMRDAGQVVNEKGHWRIAPATDDTAVNTEGAA